MKKNNLEIDIHKVFISLNLGVNPARTTLSELAIHSIQFPKHKVIF